MIYITQIFSKYIYQISNPGNYSQKAIKKLIITHIKITVKLRKKEAENYLVYISYILVYHAYKINLKQKMTYKISTFNQNVNCLHIFYKISTL